MRPGEGLALVGHNGSGKTTIVKLLLRMYDPCAGRILLDGAPLHEYDLESLRAQVAVVYQDFARFSLTLRENIAVGALDPGGSSGRVEQAARWAAADEVARKLAGGYDTMLTRRFEGGVELSGGEWQKVALARGFVRDAALVILDEPTAALDADAEYRLFERFRGLVAGKTALLISHRFSTVRMADQIVVLENGGVLETGTHAELVKQGGRYAELFEMQAGRYRS
jgi:ATP-binding cassette subfamily B protein